MRIRPLVGEPYDGDWLDVVAIVVFWVAFAVSFAILLPFGIAVDIRNALADVDDARRGFSP